MAGMFFGSEVRCSCRVSSARVRYKAQCFPVSRLRADSMGSDDDGFVVHNRREFFRMTIAARRSSYEELERLTRAVSQQFRMTVAEQILRVSRLVRVPNMRLQATATKPVLVSVTVAAAPEPRR